MFGSWLTLALSISVIAAQQEDEVLSNFCGDECPVSLLQGRYGIIADAHHHLGRSLAKPAVAKVSEVSPQKKKQGQEE